MLVARLEDPLGEVEVGVGVVALAHALDGQREDVGLEAAALIHARKCTTRTRAGARASVSPPVAAAPQEPRAACMAAMKRPAMPGEDAKLANRVVARQRPTTKPSVRLVPSGMAIW